MIDRSRFPAWTPRLVRERAEELYAIAMESSPEDAETVEQLSADTRLKSVWNQLRRKRRIKYKHQPTGAFFRPVYDPMPSFTGYNPDGFRSRAEWMQQLAMADLFERLVYWSREPEDCRQTHLFRPYDDVSGRLRQIVSELSKSKSPAQTKKFRPLIRAADLLDAEGEAANKMELGTKPHRSATIALIARRLDAHFRSPSYGVAATIATIALKEEVTAQQVRDVWNGRVWGKGSQKRPSKHRVRMNRR